MSCCLILSTHHRWYTQARDGTTLTFLISNMFNIGSKTILDIFVYVLMRQLVLQLFRTRYDTYAKLIPNRCDSYIYLYIFGVRNNKVVPSFAYV